MCLHSCADIKSANSDVVVFINDDIRSLGEPFSPIEKALIEFYEVRLYYIHQANILNGLLSLCYTFVDKS